MAVKIKFFALFLLLSKPFVCQASIVFAGVGNDGYFRDVQGLYGAMQSVPSLVGGSDQYLFENQSGSAIASSILSLQTVLQPGDTLIWYYSGHGGWEYDGSDHDETAPGSFADDGYDETVGLRYGSEQLTDDELSQAFRSLSSVGSNIVTIFDSCYSGGFVGGTNDLNNVPGLTFFGSSDELEDSYGYDDQPYSIFTQGLINGLAGSAADYNGDGVLMASEWFDFAFEYTVGSVSNQHPVFFGPDVLIGNISPVPLPGAFWLLGSAFVGLKISLRYKRK